MTTVWMLMPSGNVELTQSPSISSVTWISALGEGVSAVAVDAAADSLAWRTDWASSLHAAIERVMASSVTKSIAPAPGIRCAMDFDIQLSLVRD